MQKRIASLFILSFLLLALALCIVPSYVQTDNKGPIQGVLIILAIMLDVIAMRYQQKQPVNR